MDDVDLEVSLQIRYNIELKNKKIANLNGFKIYLEEYHYCLFNEVF